MKIQLKSEWMDHQEGAILDLKEGYAQSLVDRGIAVLFGEEKKGLKKPALNKMVSTSTDK